MAPVGEILEDSVQRRADQPGAIVIRNNFDTFRKYGGIQNLDACFERLQHFGRVVAFAHVHDPKNNIILAVLPDDALHRQVAHGNFGDVLDEHGCAAVGGDDDIFDFIGGTKHADPANQILLRTLCHIAAAHIGVAPAQRIGELLQTRCRSNASSPDQDSPHKF